MRIEHGLVSFKPIHIVVETKDEYDFFRSLSLLTKEDLEKASSNWAKRHQQNLCDNGVRERFYDIMFNR